MESNSNEFMTDSCVDDQQPQEPRSSSDILAPNLALQLQLSLHSAEVSASASSASASNTPRIRWTQELHEAFADAVNQLGGCKRATPEGVLRLMNVEGLTIYHVRRHLQKYRVARVKQSESSEDNSDDSMTDVEQMSPVNLTMNITTTKALRMQIKLQKQLHEQLEIQRKLQLHIEEQGKRLLQMLESQNKAEDKLPCKGDSDVYDTVSMDTNASSQALAETSRGSNGKRQVLESSSSADQCPVADESAPPPMKCPRSDNSLSK
ncbi:hypothetical protein vseg_021353 [Gypsophila vaccaria]